MKLTLDTQAQTLSFEDNGDQKNLNLYSDEAFQIISKYWIKIGWNQKYPYTFSWLGRPIIQLPEDMIRMQEVIYKIQPDIIIETGVAHGGSLIFYSSLCKAMDKGRVIGVDIEIRPHNRKAIETHPLCDRITLIEGSSISQNVVDTVSSMVKPNDVVLVILDSNHTYDHVLAELRAYSGLVSPGSYIVATDGVMLEVSDVPRGQRDWDRNNPTRAAADFALQNPSFVIEQPTWPFNESTLSQNVTHWPGAWLRRT